MSALIFNLGDGDAKLLNKDEESSGIKVPPPPLVPGGISLIMDEAPDSYLQKTLKAFGFVPAIKTPGCVTSQSATRFPAPVLPKEPFKLKYIAEARESVVKMD